MGLVAGAVLLFGLGCTALPVGSGGVDGPVIYSGESPFGGGEDAQISGVITLEGECLYLSSLDDPALRYPVVWPRGTQWQEDPPGVVLPDGHVAVVGDVATGSGGYHHPEDVESRADADGAELADRCADGPSREVAIFNPGSDVNLELLPFEDPRLFGLCEDMIADFAEGEPGASSTEEEAVAEFVDANWVLRGLVVEDGKIYHLGEQVGTYDIITLPEDTLAVESAEWCYPVE